VTPKSLIEPARHAGTALLRSQTDARLVDLTRDGNERAFEAIVQRYRGPLLRYCSRLLPAARAEDAVQQAFLSAHRSIHAGDAELNLRPWLYRIAHNASLNLLRQNGFDHEQVSEEIDGVETPPQAFERGERLRVVVAAVKDLPDRQRDAIVLQAMEGRSYDEIAAELGVTDGAVRQLLNRARTTLREAAAAITPTGLLTRVASSGGEAGVTERIAQVVAGAGGGALIAKAGVATLVVAGAVAGGAATGALPGTGGHPSRSGSSSAAAAASAGGDATAGGALGARATGVALRTRSGGASQATRVTLTNRHGPGGGGPGSGGSGGRSAAGLGGGSGSSGDGGHHGGDSGSGGGDHSGSGSGGDGHSGSSDGGDHSGSGSSGSGSSGSGSGSGDHSGSGSSGSSGSGDGGSSGSGSSGSGSSGSGSSGSGSSGSGGAVTTLPTTSGHDRSGTSGSGDSSGDSSGSGSGKGH
jgi:RNA polymerase sigma factor (sigma-70 family)